MNNQDKVYVIYFDGEMFTEHGRKCAYLKESSAKTVITSETRRIAHNMFDEAKTKQCWYDIGEESKQEWLDKAEERFEIREFVEKVVDDREDAESFKQEYKTNISNQDKVEIENLKDFRRRLVDNRNEQVYCTNCKHFDKLLNTLESNDSKIITPSPCCVCYPYNPMDSVKKMYRRKYEEGR